MIKSLKEVKASEAKEYAIRLPRPGIRDKTCLFLHYLSVQEELINYLIN